MYRKITTILILILPLFLFCQQEKKEKVEEKKTKNKTDAYSGSTYYSKTKGNISGRVTNKNAKNLSNLLSREFIFVGTSERDSRSLNYFANFGK